MSGEQRLSVGQLVAGRYRLCDLVGRGAMGTVWLASDGVLCREVAVKEVTYPPYLSDEERRCLRERTLREARAAARFAHPKVTTVHDVVEQDGKPYIVMEHVRSRNLIQVVREEGPLPWAQVARIGLDLLGALQAAHRAGIVHRDVKPANVLLDGEGQAWLTDFGIATSSGDSAMTTDGILLGSPSYMSPERARGQEPGPAADLWSLGATLYTTVEGRPPFENGDPVATLVAVLSEEPAPMCAAGPLAPVLSGLLIKEPTQRWTAERVREALEEIPRGTAPTGDVAAAPPPRPATPDAASAERGNLVARIAREEILAVAASATLAGRAARGAAKSAARGAARAADRGAPRRPGRYRTPVSAGHVDSASSSVVGPAAPPSTATPPSPRQAPGPARRPAGRTAAPDPAPRWRFKRRWIAIPLLLIFCLGLLLVGAAAVIIWALLAL